MAHGKTTVYQRRLELELVHHGRESVVKGGRTATTAREVATGDATQWRASTNGSHFRQAVSTGFYTTLPSGVNRSAQGDNDGAGEEGGAARRQVAADGAESAHGERAAHGSTPTTQ
jgi:hypothetical protein